jgi:glutaredoxin
MFGWLWRRRADLSRLQVVMYTRQGCHLCEEAWTRLKQARRRYAFVLEQIDVDGDPALAARYGEEVPVVTVNGKERFRGGVNAVLLERLLSAMTNPP